MTTAAGVLRPATTVTRPVPGAVRRTPGAGVHPAPRPTSAPPLDPWQWHDYATRVASVERAAWDTAAAEVGHTAVEVRALVALRQTARAVGALGARIGLTSGGATKLCRRLDELGLVERREVADDLRGVSVHLTERGREVAQQAAMVYADEVRRRAAEVRLAA